MSEKDMIMHIEIGIVKELFTNKLLTEAQKEKAIQLLKDNEGDDEYETSRRLLQGINR